MSSLQSVGSASKRNSVFLPDVRESSLACTPSLEGDGCIIRVSGRELVLFQIRANHLFTIEQVCATKFAATAAQGFGAEIMPQEIARRIACMPSIIPPIYYGRSIFFVRSELDGPDAPCAVVLRIGHTHSCSGISESRKRDQMPENSYLAFLRC